MYIYIYNSIDLKRQIYKNNIIKYSCGLKIYSGPTIAAVRGLNG